MSLKWAIIIRMLELDEILAARTDLPTLSSAAPAIWEEVFSSIKKQVTTGQIDSLASLRQEQLQILAKWTGAKNSTFAASHHAREAALRAKMTVLAIDQFSDAIVGKIGAKASLKDRLIFSTTIGRALIQNKLLSCHQFDRSWNWLHDKAWAAGRIQHWGSWLIPTVEFMDRIKEHAGGRTILEIGAGHGYCAKSLQERGVDVIAVDDFSWQNDHAEGKDANKIVLNMDAALALKKFHPKVVFCSWPPPGNSFEQKVFTTTSVELYIVVVSKHRFASGDWRAYQQQTGFTCSTSEPLNQLLRPLEAEHQVLLFRKLA